VTAFTFRIAEEIFQRFSGCVRGVVIAHKLANGPSPQARLDLLREAEATVRAHGESGAYARRHSQGEPEGADP
jgi:hypothetical protein